MVQKDKFETIPSKVWYLLGSLIIIRLIYIFILPIIPQEAYYWYYSQKPALSYYDHPPMTAWSIWLGTKLFGSTVFGIKFMAVIWAFLTGLLLYVTVQKAQILANNSDKSLPWKAVAVYHLTVFSHMYSVLMVPDNPLIFFWLLTIYFIIELFNTEKIKYWFLSGIALGFAMLSKYTAVAIIPGVFIALIISKKQRRWLKTPWPYLAVIVAFAVFSPVIIWNMQNHWASFAFQFTHRAEDARPFTLNYLGQLIASQLAILTPLVFGLFISLIWRMRRPKELNFSVKLLFLTGIFLIGGFALISLKSLIKMNWLLPGYMGWFAALVLLFPEKISFRGKAFRYSAYFSFFLIFVIYVLQLIPNVPLGEGNTWSGWRDASQKIYQLQQERGGKAKCFIFANSYKSASMLKFYLPDQQDTYAQNIYGRPALQFDIWGTPDSLKGKDALYVFTNRMEYRNDLKYVKKYFKNVSLLREFNYKFGDKPLRTIYCYLAEDYLGAEK